MAAKHGIALLLSPHDGDEGEHEEGGEEADASAEDAVQAFFEAGEKKDWAAAAAAYKSLCAIHKGDDEDEGGEEG